MAGFFETESWFWIKSIVNIIAIIAIILLFLIELYVAVKVLKKLMNHGSDTKLEETLLVVIPLLLYLGNILIISASLMDDFELSDVPCLTWTQMASSTWLINKCFLYLLLILRLHTVYGGTAFAYSKHLLLPLVIFVIIETVIMSILLPINTTVVIVYHNKVRICEGIIDVMILGIAILVDTFISFFTLYLFLKPLNILLYQHQIEPGPLPGITTVNSNSSNAAKSKSNASELSASKTNTATTGSNRSNDENSTKFYDLTIKFSTLTMIMVLTTFFTLVIIGLFDIQSVGVLDSFINCVCIALFNKKYAKYFNYLCCGAIPCAKLFAHHCCCCAYKKAADKKSDVDIVAFEIEAGAK